MTTAELTITSEFRSALTAVSNGANVFITGKAGTGKSTLLGLIRELDLQRATSVVAPTGVAALNVEGETMHRFFGFRPSLGPELRQYRPPRHLGDVETLIVDEVSMARADLLDMMDVALRRAGRTSEPFGGIQLILIGDLYQLSPVVTDADADALLKGYASPFFFSARALRSFHFETVELNHVFRQKDDRFIRLLNSIRDGTATSADLTELNTRVDSDFSPADADSYITLATTNRSADAVNHAMLDSLASPIFTSTATINGDFDPRHYAAETHLSFAVGAQVMLLVNTDNYVNGSLGRIVDVVDDNGGCRAFIELADSGETVEVGPHTWEIVRSTRHDGQVVTEVVGSLTQLPFRLAWSVTVHKSQGKTFDRVVFDRGRRVFAAGQLYVALSRCTTMDGLVLKKPLRDADVITDPSVKRFHARAVAKPQCFDDETRSYIGYVATGGGEYSKLVEIAVIRDAQSGKRLVVETLVNPLRDLGEAVEAGIRASDLSLAPTVEEIRPLLAAVLSETVLVTHGLDEFHRMMGWEHADVAEGLGVDLQAHIDSDLDRLPKPALARAQAAEEAATALANQELPIAACGRGASRVQSGVHLRPRSSELDVANALERLDELAASEDEALHLMLAVVAGAHEQQPTLVDHVRSRARQRGVSSEALATAAEDVLSSLVAAADRDGRMSATELATITAFASALGLRAMDVDPTEPSRQVELRPGMRVCFTGSPPAGDQHAELTKTNLRAIAAALGLEETQTVTKSKCDLVVAFDPSSMSGKAKKAREFKKPVISSTEFLSLAAAAR